MATQDERLTTLEQTTREYRPVLQNFAYELTMVKGLIITQTGITQELREDMNDVKVRLTRIEDRMTRIEEQLSTILTLLSPS